MNLMCKTYGNFENASKAFQNQIYNGRSVQSILTEFNLSVEDLIFGLQKHGQEEYYIHGIIDYYKQFYIPTNKVLVISDTHIGKEKSNFDKIAIAYNHAIKNNINYVIHVGDLVEGYSNPYSSFCPIGKQFERVRDIYKTLPDNIITYYIYGNHDYNLLHYNDIDIKESLSDLVNLKYIGTKFSFINLVDNDFIKLFHEIRILEYIQEPAIKVNLSLYGHSHTYSIRDNNILMLPTLEKTGYIDGFVELETTGNEYITKYYPITVSNEIKPSVEKVFKKQLIKN